MGKAGIQVKKLLSRQDASVLQTASKYDADRATGASAHAVAATRSTKNVEIKDL